MQVYLETQGVLSLIVSFGAISQALVERLEAVNFVSDNSVEDIVFTSTTVLTPTRRSDNALVILFQYEDFNLPEQPHKEFLMALCGHILLWW